MEITTFVYLLVQKGSWLKHFDTFVYSSKKHFPFDNFLLDCYCYPMQSSEKLWKSDTCENYDRFALKGIFLKTFPVTY